MTYMIVESIEQAHELLFVALQAIFHHPILERVNGHEECRENVVEEVIVEPFDISGE